MKIAYSEHHAAWRAAIQDWVERVLRPKAEKFDFDRVPSREEWDVFEDQLLGYGIVDEFPLDERGEPDLIAFAILTEELARVDGSLPFTVWHRLQNPLFFGREFTDEQRKHYAHLLDGRAHMGGSLSEPDSGSDPSGIRTTARREGNQWVINGQKVWSSGASHADAIAVFCRVKEEDGSDNGFGLFLVERHQGFQAREIDTMGLRGHSLCEVYYDDVRVDDIARIGGSGAQGSVYGTIGRARIMTSFVAVGLAQAALDHAVAYTKDRSQFGRKIGQFQLVQEMLAEMAIGVETSRLIAFKALNTLVEHGDRAARMDASMAKAHCTEVAFRVASLAVQVHGGNGLTTEFPVERIFRDARMLVVPDGTTQIQQLIIGRELTGLSAFR